MGIEDLQQYLSKHCRFRFRGGKVVYGVVWESEKGLVFASKDGHEAYLGGTAVATSTDLMNISHDDVMAAEVIA